MASCVGWAVPALAHDTGFGHSRRTLYFAPDQDGLLLEYRVRLEADEALIEMSLMDTDGDASVSPAEQDSWFTAKGAQLAVGLRVMMADDETVAVPVQSRGWRLAEGFCQIFLFHLQSNSRAVIVEDSLFAHKHGWARVRQAPGVRVMLADGLNLNHAERLRLRVLPALNDATKEPAHGGQRQ